MEDAGLQPTAQNIVAAMGRRGATHVAVGEISGAREKATLKYQLYHSPGNKPVGAPVVLTGRLNDIRLALPGAVVQLCRTSELVDPKFSPSILESVSDLEFLGSLDPEGGTAYASNDSPRLEKLAEHSALAALFRVVGCRKGMSSNEVLARSEPLLRQASHNAVAWGVFGMVGREIDPRWFPEALSPLLDAALDATPRNTQLAIARTGLHIGRQEWKQALGWAQEAARCNTRDPQPFQLVAECLRGEARSRSQRARRLGGATREVSEAIWVLNSQRLAMMEHAATLDPEDGNVWEGVSFAAALQRKRERAEEALRKAIIFNGRNGSPYWWGIDLYGRGFLNDPEARQRFAEIVASADLKGPELRIYTAQLLHYRGLKGKDGKLYTRVLRTDHERKQVADWVAGKKIPWAGNPPAIVKPAKSTQSPAE